MRGLAPVLWIQRSLAYIFVKKDISSRREPAERTWRHKHLKIRIFWFLRFHELLMIPVVCRSCSHSRTRWAPGISGDSLDGSHQCAAFCLVTMSWGSCCSVLPALLCGAFNIQALNFIIARHLPIQICKDTKTERKKKHNSFSYLPTGRRKKKRPPIDFFCRKGNPNTDETAGLDLLLWPIHPDRWGVGNGSLPMRFGGEKTNKDFQELGPWFFL